MDFAIEILHTTDSPGDYAHAIQALARAKWLPCRCQRRMAMLSQSPVKIKIYSKL